MERYDAHAKCNMESRRHRESFQLALRKLGDEKNGKNKRIGVKNPSRISSHSLVALIDTIQSCFRVTHCEIW
ncbi:CLUMA_CG007260, isoform A [Clunio marinus]|uniref:CLUMA_CG007260, isoform A n=1 Tax=Clunio marinus TaxID=568069 RepID=A0A1J1I2B3_9DIPT|nr:CLUMA_CG007260, isoform A [Clunio marinus]